VRVLLLSVATGVIAIAGDHLHWPQPKFFNAHLLFGAALVATVGRCLHVAWHSPLDAVQYHLYTRSLARRVYLLLYALAAVRLSFSIPASSVNADQLSFFGHLARDDSLADFQIYIGYAYAAILIIRMCAGFASNRRSHSLI
jgi:hypothetical protein